ncbi:MAG: FAD-dependent oxidoreductase [Gammaproteobacteria bacterium]|nr:FAD-dependent oxidoreductase [Gammaproteobacteria bacterium]MDH5800907.1 FAD-dependent oxidoreductase [Gammaproteobacteria bacterium]
MTLSSAKITAIQALSPTVKLLELSCEPPLSFIPGQWVLVEANRDGKTEAAAYSISSIPNSNNSIEIAVKHVTQIPISGYLHQLKTGEPLQISAAQGDTVLPQNPTGPMVFIAGGTGIAPLLCMAKSLLQNQYTYPIRFLISCTTLDECIFHEELQQLRKTADFDFSITTTKEQNPKATYHGRINDAMLNPLLLDQAQFYLCGPPNMVDHVNERLIQCGVAAERVYFDKWW